MVPALCGPTIPEAPFFKLNTQANLTEANLNHESKLIFFPSALSCFYIL